MNSTNNSFSSYLSSYSKSKLNDNSLPITHTRIGSKEHQVFGGSYSIPNDKRDEFYNKYYNHVFVNREKEYLTEKQLSEKCPIAIDIDFRYSFDINERQHTTEHIIDLIQLYLEELKKIVIFEDNKPFYIFILEKKNINKVTEKEICKDGIHIIIGIQLCHELQCYLREQIVSKIHTIWDLPITNDWDSVFDEGISKGSTNWQMFGSQKPNHEPYELSHISEVSFDSNDGEFITIPKTIAEFNLKKNFSLLSVRYGNHPCFDLTANSTNILNNAQNKKKLRKPVLLVDNIKSSSFDSVQLSDICNQNSLEQAVNCFLKSLKSDEYGLRELHEYTQILPGRFYEPGSHLENRKVAFGLKNTDDRLFLSWVMLRSKASDFDYSTIPDLKKQWDYFSMRKDGITKKSIMYFAKQYCPVEYENVKKNTIAYYIDETIKSGNADLAGTDFDLALVLYQMFKDKYVCSSIVQKKFYTFHNHRWVLDQGYSLRLAISSDMYALYQDKILEYMHEMQKYSEEDIARNNLQIKIRSMAKLCQKMKMSQHKNNIMREAMELFYDKDFIRKQDSNKYLMCFNNCVVDFKNKEVRVGYPHDYITKSTHLELPDLADLEKEENKETIEKIEHFMHTLFPKPDLKRYMWDHLASTLIGYKKEQVFTIYKGSGSNGKSILTDFMGKVLGEYKGTIPITLVTDKRHSIGGTSSELISLKGVRYAVMQEPCKGSVLNEGVVKEITGGDPIQARALYCESEIFELQASVAVCTNYELDLNSTDDGTMRRMHYVNFMSKFAAEGDEYTDDTPFVFPKDKSLKEKLPLWAPLFAAMLVKRAFQTEGEVVPCEEVMASTRQYRQRQDTISAFINEMVVPMNGQYLGKQSVNTAFKAWYQSNFGNRKMPKAMEVHDALDKKYTKKNKRNQWLDVTIRNEDDDELE